VNGRRASDNTALAIPATQAGDPVTLAAIYPACYPTLSPSLCAYRRPTLAGALANFCSAAITDKEQGV
jgi:hypothetical protein